MKCPWDNWVQADLGFCEQSLCAWVKQPGNTWSNVGYLAMGFWIWNRARKDGILSVRMLAISAWITGVGSAFFHASGTRWAGAIDLLGMFLGTGALTALNVRRWLNSGLGIAWSVFGFVSLSLMGVAGSFPNSERWVYVLSGPCCLIELGLYFRDRPRTVYRKYLLAWLSVGLATLFWWLDIQNILCDPRNHVLSGHALWHLLSAVAFYFLYLFYKQFSVLRT